jgi:hypothetical protein
MPPNKRLQLTPLRVDKIVAILNDRISSNVFSVYQCGATEARSVGRHASPVP